MQADVTHNAPAPARRRAGQKLLSVLGWLALLLLILLAAAVGVARYLADNLDDHRPYLEALISEQLGQPVSIGHLQASWEGPSLSVRASRIAVGGLPGLPADGASPETTPSLTGPVRLEQLRLRFAGLRSLWRRSLVFDRIEADSLDLVLTRDEHQRLQVAALSGDSSPEPGEPAADPEWTQWLPEHWQAPGYWLDRLASRVAEPRLRITRVTVGIQAPDDELVFVDVPQVDILVESGRILASGRAMQSGTNDQLAAFSLAGEGLLDGNFDGRLYTRLRPGRLFEAFSRELSWRHLALQSGQGEVQAWWTFREGRLTQVNSRVEEGAVSLQSGDGTLITIRDIEASLGWRANGTTLAGGHWFIRDLGWRWQDQSVSGIGLRMEPSGTRAGFTIQGSRLPMEPLAALVLELDLLPAPAREALLSYQPGGLFESVRLTFPGQGDSPFELSARLEQVSVKAHDGAPGGQGVNGLLWLDASGGWVEAEGQGVTLGFPDLFLEDWELDRVSGRVGWLLEPAKIRVFGRRLTADYQGETRLTGAFDLRLNRDGDDNLGLAIDLWNGRADMLGDFVPAKVVGDELYQWLTTAITGGRVLRGEFRGHGQVGWGTPEGSFSTTMRYQFEDGEITYDPGWPEVTGATGEVVITNGETDVRLSNARTAGLDLEPGRVQLLSDEQGTRVEAEIAAAVTGDQVAFLLVNTPLGEMAGAVADTVTVKGNYDVELGLSIPLDMTQTFDVWGQLTTANGQVHYPVADLTWDEIHGSIVWDSRQAPRAGELTARFMGQPVTARFQLSPLEGQLEIDQTGRLAVERLGQHLSELFEMPELMESGLKGLLPYQASLSIGAGTEEDASTRLSLTADTRPLASSWPAPLGKAGGTEEDEALTVTLQTRPGDRLALTGRWGQRASFGVAWDEEGLTGADLILDSQSGKGNYFALPAVVNEGVRVRGRFERLDPAHWLEWLHSFSAETSESITSAGTAMLTSSESVPWLQRLELEAAELVVGGLMFPDIRLTATPETGGWLIAGESERARGRMSLPAGANVAWIDLEQLRLARTAEQKAEDSPEVSVTQLTPLQQFDAFRALATETWPELDVRIESLWMGEDHAGAWSFVMHPEADQVTIEDIQGRLGSLAAEGSLKWGVRSGSALTELSITLEGGALNDLSGLIGEDLPLRNNGTVVGLDLSWPGRPDQLVPGQLNGKVSLRLDDGVILQDNSSAQLFRVFSLLNTDTLQRRLRFDFSDLYESGVAFDAVSGSANVEQGVLTWDPELQMAGPSVAFRVTGSTDLADESLDMRLVAVLPVTQNLPLAAILIGASPPVGGALFVLDKLLGEPLSRLTSATYSVTGSWDNPEVRLRNIFDTGD